MKSFTELLANHQHIHENIKFADQKAIVIIGLNGGLLGAICPIMPPGYSHTLIYGAVVAICLSAGIGLAVIWPRGKRNRERGAGIVDAARIGQHTEESYRFAVESATPEILLAETIDFIYDRATTDRRKYHWLRLALKVSLAGWILALTFAFWAKAGDRSAEHLIRIAISG